MGQRVDAIARARLRTWLRSEGIPEGPGQIIQVNRRLYEPTGGGSYRIPDIRIPGARIIMDGTIGDKGLASPQIADFIAFSSGDRVIIIRPTALGGSFGLLP